MSYDQSFVNSLFDHFISSANGNRKQQLETAKLYMTRLSSADSFTKLVSNVNERLYKDIVVVDAQSIGNLAMDPDELKNGKIKKIFDTNVNKSDNATDLQGIYAWYTNMVDYMKSIDRLNTLNDETNVSVKEIAKELTNYQSQLDDLKVQKDQLEQNIKWCRNGDKGKGIAPDADGEKKCNDLLKDVHYRIDNTVDSVQGMHKLYDDLLNQIVTIRNSLDSMNIINIDPELSYNVTIALCRVLTVCNMSNGMPLFIIVNRMNDAGVAIEFDTTMGNIVRIDIGTGGEAILNDLESVMSVMICYIISGVVLGKDNRVGLEEIESGDARVGVLTTMPNDWLKELGSDVRRASFKFDNGVNIVYKTGAVDPIAY